MTTKTHTFNVKLTGDFSAEEAQEMLENAKLKDAEIEVELTEIGGSNGDTPEHDKASA